MRTGIRAKISFLWHSPLVVGDILFLPGSSVRLSVTNGVRSVN